jgi:hypothetical protein
MCLFRLDAVDIACDIGSTASRTRGARRGFTSAGRVRLQEGAGARLEAGMFAQPWKQSPHLARTRSTRREYASAGRARLQGALGRMLDGALAREETNPRRQDPHEVLQAFWSSK